MGAINNDLAIYYCTLSRKLLAEGKLQKALEVARAAYHKNKYRRDTWLLMAQVLKARGDEAEAILYGMLLASRGDNTFSKDYTVEQIMANDKVRDYFYLGMINVSHCPIITDCFDETGGLCTVYERSNIGNFLPGEMFSDESFRYFCGVFNTNDFKNYTARRIDVIDRDKEKIYDPYNYDNMPFDVMRVQLKTHINGDCADKTIILPLAGMDKNQEIVIGDGNQEKNLLLGKYEFTMMRCSGRFSLRSDKNIALGEPIILEHSPKRHKLVLNILLDGLSWSAMAKRCFKNLPNLLKFFSKGLIFDEAYCAAEYTFPSLNCMSTGKYMHHSGIIDEAIYAPYDGEVKTISQQMKAQGYYCVNIMGDGRGGMTGAMRGFDRLVINPYLKNEACTGVRRTIDHLEAFSECDNYVFLHVLDPHPFGKTVPFSMPVQTKFFWQNIGLHKMKSNATLRLESVDVYQCENLYMIKRMDAELGILFDYLESHYDDDEYVINVFSDHGTSVYDDEKYYFKDTQCHVAMMCRGAGIPQGVHARELVSGIDLYAIMAKECGFVSDVVKTDANVPAILGGVEREIVYSNSIFPGQTYKLCMRTNDYECRLETKEAVSKDCVIDVSNLDIEIYTRDEEHKLVDDIDVNNYFIDKAAEFLAGLVESM